MLIRGRAEALADATGPDGAPTGPMIRLHPSEVISWGMRVPPGDSRVQSSPRLCVPKSGTDEPVRCRCRAVTHSETRARSGRSGRSPQRWRCLDTSADDHLIGRTGTAERPPNALITARRPAVRYRVTRCGRDHRCHAERVDLGAGVRSRCLPARMRSAGGAGDRSGARAEAGMWWAPKRTSCVSAGWWRGSVTAALRCWTWSPTPGSSGWRGSGSGRSGSRSLTSRWRLPA